jgi:hypothetical protein
MFCTKCGISVSNDDKFCSKCGNKIERNIENQKIEQVNEVYIQDSEDLSFNGIRKLNWFFVYSTSGIFLYHLIQGSKSSTVVFSLFLIYMLAVSVPLTSAVALGKNDFSMFGLYFSIDENKRKKLLKIALVLNWIILVVGCIGIAFSFFREQLGPTLALLIYVIPAYWTIQAIRTVRLHNK